jgi:hypothetical protein
MPNTKLPRERIKHNDWRIGHHPDEPQMVQDWTFRRCFCGFVLIMTPAGEVYWLRARSNTQRVKTLDQLFYALATRCHFYRRPEDRRHILNFELELARRRIKELTAPVPKALTPAPKAIAPQPAPAHKVIRTMNYRPITPRGARR